MSKFLSALFVLLFVAGPISAQVLPGDGSDLNYRLIGFAPFAGKKPATYDIQIAIGDHSTDKSFNENIIKTVTCKTNRKIVEVPSFGSKYTWRTVIKTASKTTYGSLHHFATSTSAYIDTANAMRLRVIDSAVKYKRAFVFLDGCPVLYDMKGNPVWFLPEKDNGFAKYIQDLKVSPAGTITFLASNEAYEINYDGDILWKAPNNGLVSGSDKEQYHHEFTRLSNGNYMVLGMEYVDKAPYGTVIEYNSKGDVIWSWKSSKYYKKSDLVNYLPTSGMSTDLHANAFFFDENEKMVYLSFRNISRIVKIKYPQGEVLNTFGDIYMPNGKLEGNKLFSGQHACKYSRTGCLFLFNNNNGGINPKVKMLKEMQGGTLNKIWEYECMVEGHTNPPATASGNVCELPGNSVFVSMGNGYAKLLIIDRNKKTLWSAVGQKWDPDTKKWNEMCPYRASIMYDDKQLEKLLFSGEMKGKTPYVLKQTRASVK